ncbi:MAG: tetratricopeptide repeat protein [Betaproteobacteria bacterium]
MTRDDYAHWLELGRAHQAEARPVDAMLCYRRAVRGHPQGADAHFHLGEVLWQLGRMSQAIGAWRDAVSVGPDGLAAHLALSEACLAVGDFTQAETAAERASALSLRTPRALLILGTARLRGAEEENGGSAAQASVACIEEALEREPGLVTVPSLAGPLAAMIDRCRDATLRARLVRTISAFAQRDDVATAMPALLLALIAEARDDGGIAFDWGLAVQRPYGASEHDAVRRLTLVASTASPVAASGLAQRYAEICLAAFSSPVPLPWPRRTPGSRWRVLVLVAASEALAALARLEGALSNAARARCEMFLAIIGNAADTDLSSLSVNGATTRVIALSEFPDVGDARRLAALDADMLVDLAGLAASTGPVLAQRPARTLITTAAMAASAPVPLVDMALATLAALEAQLPPRAAESGIDAAMPAAHELAALLNDAVRLHQAGEHVQAAARYDEVLRWQPTHAPTLLLRGTLRRDVGELEGALADFLAASDAAPLYLDARVAAAQAAIDCGRADLAVQLVESHLGSAHAFVALWRVFGLTHLARGDGQAAAAIFEQALLLDMTDGETHYNHGVALQMQRRHADAARAYQRALAFRPDLTAADFNLGVLFTEQGNVDAAIAAYRQVLRDNPRHAIAYRNLGNVLFAAGRIDAWKASFERFEANCPSSLLLAVQALEVCQHWGDFERLDHYLDGLRNERFAARNDAELAESLEELQYLLLFFDIEPEILHRFARTYDAAATGVYGAPVPRPQTRRPGRLRIGYLSADLRNHVMGKMIWQAVQHHDRTRFELFFYNLGAASDDWTARFRELADHFVPLAHRPERQAAERIAADDIDLLVDLSTHTKGAKPGILARKPARVQLTHVASAGAVGLSAIDFKLTDNFADVPGNQEHMIETLLPMAGCVYPFRHVAPAPVHRFHRERLGIAADAVVIGAFVAPMKLSRRCLRLWTEVLQRVPQARLAISPLNPALGSSFLRLADTAGIPRERLLLLPQGRDDAENQARYALVDFVLDPMPFGGVNGTLEALDMGVPVVTLCGRKHGERTSYSILANLGVLQTVAMNGPQYVELAVRLADDPVFMREVRRSIRERLPGSPLTDMTSHARHLEAAYIAALAQRCPEALAAQASR